MFKSISLPSMPKLTKVELNALFTAVIMLLVMAATKTYIFSLATGALLVVPTVALYALMGTLTYIISLSIFKDVAANKYYSQCKHNNG